MVVRSTGTLRGLRGLRSVHSLVWAVALFAAATMACPNDSDVGGVDGSGYTCTEVDDSTDGCTTAGSLTDLTGTFAAPERTGQRSRGSISHELHAPRNQSRIHQSSPLSSHTDVEEV